MKSLRFKVGLLALCIMLVSASGFANTYIDTTGAFVANPFVVGEPFAFPVPMIDKISMFIREDLVGGTDTIFSRVGAMAFVTVPENWSVTGDGSHVYAEAIEPVYTAKWWPNFREVGNIFTMESWVHTPGNQNIPDRWVGSQFIRFNGIWLPSDLGVSYEDFSAPVSSTVPEPSSLLLLSGGLLFLAVVAHRKCYSA